jgi:hypothetical protein
MQPITEQLTIAQRVEVQPGSQYIFATKPGTPEQLILPGLEIVLGGSSRTPNSYDVLHDNNLFNETSASDAIIELTKAGYSRIQCKLPHEKRPTQYHLKNAISIDAIIESNRMRKNAELYRRATPQY